DEVGALPVGFSNQMLDIRAGLHAPAETGDTFRPRSVNENVKNVLPVLQHALSSPADDHAISPRVGFGDEVPAERSHRLRVEDFQPCHRGDSLERAMPEASTAGTVYPGVDVLVALLRQFGIHLSDPRDPLDQSLVQQIPSHLLGNLPRNDAPTAAVLPGDCQYSEHEFLPPTSQNIATDDFMVLASPPHWHRRSSRAPRRLGLAPEQDKRCRHHWRSGGRPWRPGG